MTFCVVGPSLYSHPEVYGALLAPDWRLLRELRHRVAQHLDAPLSSVMDPACGPANLLIPFAKRGCRVAGNDIRPGMIAEARRQLRGFPAELVVGDMRELTFKSGPFDVAFNLSASIGHLKRDRDVLAHLLAVARHLRPGGLFLLGLTVFERNPRDQEPWPLFESDLTPIPSGGVAAVKYVSLWRDGQARQERIQVVVLAKGVAGCPGRIVEEYTLRTFPPATLRRLLTEAAVFDLVANHDQEEGSNAGPNIVSGSGDRLLILKKRA